MIDSSSAVSPPPEVPPIGLIYYSGQGVYVTERLFVCAGRKIALTRLSNVQTVRAPMSAITINAGIAAAAVSVVLVVAGGLLHGTAWLGGLVVLAVPVAVLLVGLTRPRAYELWADVTAPVVPGLPEVTTTRVLLLRVAEGERYHQICRAIVRALEHGRS